MAVTPHILANLSSVLPNDVSALEAAISALKSSISALEISINNLELASPSWETFSLVCSVLVGVGVVLEVIGLIWEFRSDTSSWRRRSKVCERPSVSLFCLEFAAIVLVVVGIFGEAKATSKLASINSQLRSRTSELRAKGDQLLSLVTLEVGAVKDSASQAAASALLAQQASDESVLLAGGLQTKLGRLKADVAPRRLSKSQQDTIRKAVEFAPNPIAVTFNPMDSEARDFAGDFISALHDAHWNPVQAGWIPNGKYGVFLSTVDTADSTTSTFIALMKGIRAAGISVEFLPLKEGDTTVMAPATRHVLYLLVADHPPMADTKNVTPKTTKH